MLKSQRALWSYVAQSNPKKSKHPLMGSLEAANVCFMLWLLRHDAIEVQSSTKSLIRAIPRVHSRALFRDEESTEKKKCEH